MVSYILFLVRASLRNVAVGLALVALSLVLLLGFLAPTGALGYGHPLFQGTYAYDSSQLNASIASGRFQSAPRDLQALLNEEAACLESAATAESPQAFYEAVASVEDVRVAECDAGYLDTYRSALIIQRELASKLADLPDVAWFYDGSRSYPALYYLAWIVGMVPQVTFVIPCIVAAASVCVQRSGVRLLARPPLGLPAYDVSGVVASAACSLAILALASAPAFVVALVANGLGDATFPVVFNQAGEVRAYTAGGVILRFALLYALFSLFVGGLAELGRAVTGNALIGSACACVPAAYLFVSQYMPALFATPDAMLESYYASLSADHALSPEWMSWLPTTYLDLASTSGHATPGDAVDVLAVRGASWPRACVVMALCSAACAVLAIAAARARLKAHVREDFHAEG